MATTIFMLNGPNLNLLGNREPDIYGRETLSDIESACLAKAEALHFAVVFRQTNSEGQLVTWIQEAGAGAKGIIINAGAYTHTSVALLDALTAVDLPVIEIHLSNVFRREDFRHRSFISPAAVGVICGFGGQSYVLALQAMADLVQP